MPVQPFFLLSASITSWSNMLSSFLSATAFSFLQLGFLLGAINEVKTAVPIVEQAKAAPVIVAAVVLLFSWASLIPITKGARSEAFGKSRPVALLNVHPWGR